MGSKNWKRKFFAIYTGQFFSLLSSAAVQFSIIWWQALVGPFAGTITDRYSRKLVLIGASGPLFSAPFYAYIQTEIEPHLLGRVFSFVTSLSLLATPIGYALAGVLIELTSVTALFSITGILIILNGVVAMKTK